MGRSRKRNAAEKAEEEEDPKKLKGRRQGKRNAAEEAEEEEEEEPVPFASSRPKKPQACLADSDVSLFGKPIPINQARERWPRRYQSKNTKKKGSIPEISKEGDTEAEEILQAKCHYTQALVDNCVFNIGDDAYVKAEDGMPDYIARIVEFFEAVNGEPYFRAQWFYRAEDTVIKDLKEHAGIFDKRRVFLSDIEDDNPLNCIVSKVNISKVSPNVDLHAKKKTIPPCDLYYDMKYTLPHLTFSSIDTVNSRTAESDISSTVSSETGSSNPTGNISMGNGECARAHKSKKSEMTLLDLYSGCGAMSTGLCMGASLSGIKLVTRWAVDINSHACKSLKLNHPETQVRNEAAEDFLSLLKEWAKLGKDLSLLGSDELEEQNYNIESVEDDDNNDDNDDEGDSENDKDSSEVFEVEKLLAICYGDPNKTKKSGLYFKVRWRGYGPSDDTWEPIEGLSNCKEKLKEFVTRGLRSKILPFPGDVDFICGGPPCQGISGFNRFRNNKAPLDDVKNKQLLVFMDIIEYLKPKYILMENVVDLLKFAGGFLGRYAIGRLVSMNYQARLGMMAAGSYGLPQFRMRVFLWGAHPTEKLPQYPLPTHDVIGRGGVPNEFEEIAVGFGKNQQRHLENALYLKDAISDLPPVSNDESEDKRNYGKAARTEFQKFIRLKRNVVVSYAAAQNAQQPRMLYDHRPLQLNQDDFERVCRIPKKKGANFRDLAGVLVGPDNRVLWDPSIKRVKVSSGKPLVPDYAMKFVKGRSTKPFGRLWWDEIVATVVTRAEPHNQVILHPEQDRVLTIRENARLQGFPDFYQLCGPVKERYAQVGNAVAVPVALALGYSFGMACQELSDDDPLTTLPFKFPSCLSLSAFKNEEDNCE